MPFFYDYEKVFCDEISKMGNEVILVRDSVDFKLVNSIQKNLFHNNFSFRFNHYIDKIIKKYKTIKFDKIILIFGGYFVRRQHILKIKQTWKDAEYIYYCWDSIKNFTSILKFFGLFDRAYSFDPYDCAKYNFKFLPLFYVTGSKSCVSGKKYDVSAIFTFDKSKYIKTHEIVEKLPKNINSFIYIYMPSKKTYLLNKIYFLMKGIYIKKSDFKFTKIPLSVSKKIYEESRCVIDCPLSNQNGLTIRCFESLNSQSKIITTNREISKYPFYNENNILIYTEDDDINSEFFESKFSPVDFMEEYCLNSFLRTLLYGEKFDYNYKLKND